MTDLEKKVAQMLKVATSKERKKTRIANARADQWRARAQMYRERLIVANKELAEARRALRNSA